MMVVAVAVAAAVAVAGAAAAAPHDESVDCVCSDRSLDRSIVIIITIPLIIL